MNEQKPISAEVKISKNGSIKVVGNFEIIGVDGKSLNTDYTNEVYLCACGRSKNKPFCDESHLKDRG